MQTVLIVDDDPHIRDVLDFALQQGGFSVRQAENGLEALESIATAMPHLVILDIMMPELDGTEVCRRLRQQGGAAAQLPLLFLTSRDDEIDRVLGLELGGDDYITKPFSPRELLARVKAVLRRTEAAPHTPSDSAEPPAAPATEPSPKEDLILSHGKLTLHLGRFEAFWEQNLIDLTATEFGMLRTLMQRPGFVFSRDQLMDGAYDAQHYVSDRTIDSHVRRVRAKFAALGGSPIETVHSLGYKLSPCL